jgi:rubredoxin
MATTDRGTAERIDATSRLECRICWYVYDPSAGDAVWQIAPGTPFSELPAHWSCPSCAATRDQFLVLSDE